jgi:phosphoribosylglycinamide formyltransferase-1
MNSTAIALFASGNGSNALNLISHFKENEAIDVRVLVCNKADAPIVQKAKDLGIEVLLFDNESFENGLTVLQELDYREIEWIVLAGFLRKIPINMIRRFLNKIINIHPSLLPKYGGKGMYGNNVHAAVLAAKEKESGISIHLVNEEFDSGEILAQFKVTVNESDTIDTLAQKIHTLEHENFPQVVEQTILKNK